MAEPSPGGVVSALWRVTLALLAAALVLNFAIGVLRCAWPWIVGAIALVLVIWAVVNRRRNPRW